MKRCEGCKKWKDYRKFYKHPKKPDGHMDECKSCHNCDIVRDRPIYGDGEPMLGDPTEDQIARECIRLQASWSDKVRESRRKAKVIA
jgi:hypothetical protein